MPSSALLRQLFASLLAFLAFATWTGPARALDATTLTAELDSLVQEGNQLLVEVSSVTLTSFTMATELETLDAAIGDYTAKVIAVYETTESASGTLSLSEDMLLGLQNLSTTSAALAQAVMALSETLILLAPTTFTATLDSSLYAMLRLSDDIGVMANRILEMADNILVMADNIGIMADRILATQLIQNTNIALVTEATLDTQKNTITLISLFL
jgi:hypothetical protein